MQELDLRNNPIKDIPPEIVHQNKEYRHDYPEATPILDYLKRLHPPTKSTKFAPATKEPTHTQKIPAEPKQPTTASESLFQPLNETKIVIAGEATTGKTSLVKRLKYNTFNEGETKL